MDNEQNKHSSLGDPLDAPATNNRKTAQSAPQPTDRPGDSGLGIPDFEPEKARMLSDRETARYNEQAEEQLRQQFDKKLKDLQEFNRSWELPAGIKKFGAGALLFVAAAAGIFIVNQAIQFSLNMNTLPQPYRWVALGAMLFFSGIIAIIIISLLFAAIRLRRLKPFDIKPLKILAERETMRRFANEKADDARKMLIDYLAGYASNKKAVRLLQSAGLKTDEIESLSVCRERLLDKSRPLSASQWLDEFKDGCQAILDKAAIRRVKEYSIKAGLGTAASPVAFVDQMIVMYSSFAMLKDIMRIYNLRPAFGQTAIVLSRSIINIYLSGMIESATESSAQGIADQLREHCGRIAGTVGKVAGAKAAEAALNGLLIYNLGSRAIKMLQPISKKTPPHL